MRTAGNNYDEIVIAGNSTLLINRVSGIPNKNHIAEQTDYRGIRIFEALP